MKPPKPQRKLEELRVTRKSNQHLQHGGGEGWAISYADMLMVLLSFFVMFFSLKDESPQTFDDQLKKISLSMKTVGGQEAGHAPASLGQSTSASESASAKQASAGGQNFSDLLQALKIPGVTVIDEKSQLVLTLDDTAFSSASFTPGPEILTKVDQVVAHLKPFEHSVQMTIVGHTDARRLVPRNQFLQDNFDLSSLRALKVLKHVIGEGFPENRATARAASSFDRDARSVSIVIQLSDLKDAKKPETGA